MKVETYFDLINLFAADSCKLVAANKITLEGVTVPASKNKLLAIIRQHLLADFGNIVPTVRHVDSKILTTNIGAVGVNYGDFVFVDGGGAHG